MNEEEKFLRLEFNWLLNEEVASILSQLKDIIQSNLNKFNSEAECVGSCRQYKGDNILLSVPHTDVVKGLVNIFGDSVIKAELRFKFPKLSTSGIGTYIFEQCPWKIQQLQDTKNHLQMVLDEITEHGNCNTATSGYKVLQLMDTILAYLSRAKTCLIVPEQHSLSELMAINAQRVLNPPVPEEMLVSFHLNCDTLVLCVYIFHILTAAPHHKHQYHDHEHHHHHHHHHHHDHHHDHNNDDTTIGHTFEHGNKWFQLSSTTTVSCIVPWIRDMVSWINAGQQLCQQLKDKISIFRNLLPDLFLTNETKTKIIKRSDIHWINQQQ